MGYLLLFGWWFLAGLCIVLLAAAALAVIAAVSLALVIFFGSIVASVAQFRWHWWIPEWAAFIDPTI